LYGCSEVEGKSSLKYLGCFFLMVRSGNVLGKLGVVHIQSQLYNLGSEFTLEVLLIGGVVETTTFHN